MAHQNGRSHLDQNTHLLRFHRDEDRDEDRDRDRYGAARNDDREFGDRYERGGAWRPEDREDRAERGDWRGDWRIDQRFDEDGDHRFGDRRWERRDGRPYEGVRGREPYGGRERDAREREDRSERSDLRVDIQGYRAPVETMPRQDQLLRGAYRDHDESNRDLSYHAGRPSGPPYGQTDERAREAPGGASGAGAPARERMPRRRGPHHGKGPVGFQRSDERIRDLVCEALTDDGEVDATHIEVSVKGGEVTLVGAVEDRRMKRLAEDCVEGVPGVKDVHNQLRIGEPQAGAANRSAHGAERPDRAEKHDRHDRHADPSDKKHRPS